MVKDSISEEMIFEEKLEWHKGDNNVNIQEKVKVLVELGKVDEGHFGGFNYLFIF